MKRVAVTGIGAVSPLGNSFSRSWEAIKEGSSGIGAITRFDASSLAWRVAGELKDFDARAFLSWKETAKLDPFIQYAVAASVMAAEDAGLTDSNESGVTGNKLKGGNKSSALVTCHLPLNSAGIIIGSSRGGISTIEKSIDKLRTPHSGLRTRISPYLMPSTTISMAASYAAQRLGIKGNCLGVSNACASGANAIGEAFRLIRHGYAEIMLAGGAEAPLCGLCIAGYGSAGVLSAGDAIEAPRPFDRARNGFALSEGACIMVLEDYGNALKRGACIYGEVIGYGNTTDSYHITRPHAEGEAKAICMAIKEAGISPDAVDYINTHGTATKLGDIAETEAIRMVFGEKASTIPATAIKSMTGHMLAASGAFEAAATLLTIKEGVIPPTINLREKDPACDLNIVTERKCSDIKIAVSNSFGFGGVNAVIVARKA